MDGQATSNVAASWIGNIAGAGTIVGVLVGWLPSIAAAVALLWYVINIYESATVQHWLQDRRTRKIARMKAAVLMLEARNGPEESSH